MAQATAQQSIWTSTTGAQAWLRRGLIVVAGSAFIALCAHIALPLPWTPVPITFQPFAVVLLGMLFGPWLGAATAALYLIEGMSGLPVFTPHGPGGIAQLLGPTGGYLMSYPFAAALAGWMFRDAAKRDFWRGLMVAIVASAVILACGACWMFAVTHLGARAIAMNAVVPFLPGDFLKAALAAGIAVAWSRWRRA